MGQRLDTYDRMPQSVAEYLSQYGWHFSKKMCEWAVSKMTTKDLTTGKEKKLEPMSKDEVKELLGRYGLRIEHDAGYDCVYVANMAKSDYYKSAITDCVYVANMAKSDYYKSAITDEMHLALFIKDYMDDEDGYDGLPFTRFFADCIGKGQPILWEDMM